MYAIGRETEYTRSLKEYEKYEKSKYKKLLNHNPESRPYISREVQNKFIYNEEQFLNAFNRPEYGVITEGITDAMLLNKGNTRNELLSLSNFAKKTWKT